MSDDASRTIELAISKAKIDPDFSKDLVNYFKYLVIENCSRGRLPELDTIFRYGNSADLLSFGLEVVPDCGNKITVYVKNYR
ncbi:hypothetical protein A3B35_03760 [Candidatus Kaiserbacteria bacterium RIFCSPLOWO2_01_FULL_54_24]|uniref:Uncharacterized protein n=1 Tax=Candidatus Kaiserbacteria bacterium RIFCSPLOWO2_01_FULL_54_24 TaxID=1798515 RepID=A0A1F6ESX7_9BACT|nr:MAG: hypothetical protein A3B35_03760 [Candidatus Kaiserbacteria bacterium RIFCSPLOWO2_01_FULL_54_24]